MSDDMVTDAEMIAILARAPMVFDIVETDWRPSPGEAAVSGALVEKFGAAMLRLVAKITRDERPRCILCDEVEWLPDGRRNLTQARAVCIVTVVPEFRNPDDEFDALLSSAICERCFGPVATLGARAREAHRKYFPDLEALPPPARGSSSMH